MAPRAAVLDDLRAEVADAVDEFVLPDRLDHGPEALLFVGVEAVALLERELAQGLDVDLPERLDLKLLQGVLDAHEAEERAKFPDAPEPLHVGVPHHDEHVPAGHDVDGQHAQAVVDVRLVDLH